LFAERVEQELTRLYRARPELADRIDRAARIIVVQLSSPTHLRPVRARIGSGGRRCRFLVDSSSTGGVVYSVDPSSFSCGCPDFRRSSVAACKHGIAVWLLLKIASERGCRHCLGGWVFVGAEAINQETGEVVEVVDRIRCRRCGGAAVKALFGLGQVVGTPGALSALREAHTAPRELLRRHQSGDWGGLGGFDRAENTRALETGARIFSAYETPAGKVWIITEADRSSTCLLLPAEY
jgi:Pyruvate/2-oxoacid:ferredoxin oxidoreductase delta subunit